MQSYLNVFFTKYDHFQNCNTLAIKMGNCNYTASILNAVKIVVDSYVLNQTSNKKSGVTVLEFPSTI